MIKSEQAVFYEPSLVITTSLRTSPLTNTLIKTLSRVMNVPVIRRGTSNLDEIAYYAALEGYQGLIVVYTRLGNPSALTMYRVVEKGFFDLYGRIFILGIHINRRHRKAFEGIGLVNNCNSRSCNDVYSFLADYLSKWIIENPSHRNFIYLVVKDLEEFREDWLLDKKKSEKLAPAELDFIDPKEQVSVLRIKVHHVWRYKQK